MTPKKDVQSVWKETEERVNGMHLVYSLHESAEVWPDDVPEYWREISVSGCSIQLGSADLADQSIDKKETWVKSVTQCSHQHAQIQK